VPSGGNESLPPAVVGQEVRSHVPESNHTDIPARDGRLCFRGLPLAVRQQSGGQDRPACWGTGRNDVSARAFRRPCPYGTGRSRIGKMPRIAGHFRQFMELPPSSSSNETATSPLALRRTVSPSISATNSSAMKWW